MHWRISRAQFEKQKGSGNKRAMKKIVTGGEVPGLIAYAGSEPIGWCALGRREVFTVLQRSRILKPVDDQPVWSVVCFFVSKPYRRKGVTVELLRAAVRYAKRKGARIVEGYPVEPKKTPMPDVFAWTGLSNAFREAGFSEVERRSPTRPIMRWQP
jgi:GNAT superfamily N-acetyltransferase